MGDNRNTSGKSGFDPSEFVRRVKAERHSEHGFDYRREALAVLPHVCAKCGREFEGKDLPLLTVHHKDGNHFNNPRDGANWELLCVYCHEDEHARGVLADKLDLKSETAKESGKKSAGAGMVSLAEKLKRAMEKK